MVFCSQPIALSYKGEAKEEKQWVEILSRPTPCNLTAGTANFSSNDFRLGFVASFLCMTLSTAYVQSFFTGLLYFFEICWHFVDAQLIMELHYSILNWVRCGLWLAPCSLLFLQWVIDLLLGLGLLSDWWPVLKLSNRQPQICVENNLAYEEFVVNCCKLLRSCCYKTSQYQLPFHHHQQGSELRLVLVYLLKLTEHVASCGQGFLLLLLFSYITLFFFCQPC